MEPLKVGDVVKITGGPEMTVEDIFGQTVYCVWFDGAILHRSTFQLDSLILVDA